MEPWCFNSRASASRSRSVVCTLPSRQRRWRARARQRRRLRCHASSRRVDVLSAVPAGGAKRSSSKEQPEAGSRQEQQALWLGERGGGKMLEPHTKTYLTLEPNLYGASFAQTLI